MPRKINGDDLVLPRERFQLSVPVASITRPTMDKDEGRYPFTMYFIGNANTVERRDSGACFLNRD
ncbi:MAG: hypothetical protein M3342_17930 [Bacteroidota bacterium]|nr:hypothetical protein [Bacteroidota bacterium]